MESTKNLILVRHAKSDWSRGELADHDRPLNDRGKKEVVQIAKFISKKTENTDIIISSTATRATETARSIADILKYEHKEIRREDILYNSSYEDYLEIIEKMGDKVSTALIVGHNPTIEELVSMLICGDPFSTGIHMPTCGTAYLTLDHPKWTDSKPGLWKLKWFIHPKLL